MVTPVSGFIEQVGSMIKGIPKHNYRIAGNFRWVQIFAIFADRPASAKIKTAKKCTKMEIVTSLRAYVDTN